MQQLEQRNVITASLCRCTFTILLSEDGAAHINLCITLYDVSFVYSYWSGREKHISTPVFLYHHVDVFLLLFFRIISFIISFIYQFMHHYIDAVLDIFIYQYGVLYNIFASLRWYIFYILGKPHIRLFFVIYWSSMEKVIYQICDLWFIWEIFGKSLRNSIFTVFLLYTDVRFLRFWSGIFIYQDAPQLEMIIVIYCFYAVLLGILWEILWKCYWISVEIMMNTIGEVRIYAVFLIYQMWDEDFLYMEKGVEIQVLVIFIYWFAAILSLPVWRSKFH